MFTAVCVALSATGHVLASCAAVPWWTLAVGFLGVFALVLPFAGRARGLFPVVVALGTGQLALHALFGLGQRHGTGTGVSGAANGDDALIRLAAELVCGAGPAALSVAEAHEVVALAGLTPPGAAAHPPAAPAADAAGLLPSVPMLLGHLLAALATGWLLRRGDLALARLVRLSERSARSAQETTAGAADVARLRPLRAALALVRALRAGLLPAAAGPPGSRRMGAQPCPPVSGAALQHTVIRRGPPAPCVLAA
ncbi:hypothetical protein [Streptomyces yaizuensis]|uniref:Membrane protein n=1 Tax=Streptomyces yaizuensis TaxID=2989713 RepID=A0ABQ5NZJ9_9ACTN|nr:hypothetical protein [Streptomyces sp. YSPA8]GLF95777.1 membrane protein [Streptomyces sp. YSPA8]